MNNVAYFNGEFMLLDQVRISPLDRGFLFADGVYEVIPVYSGGLFRLKEHLDRLENSLKAIALDDNLQPEDWNQLLQELVERNGGGNLSIYLQVTRGAPSVRDHRFPDPACAATVYAVASPFQPKIYDAGVSAVTLEDIRWKFCHIKSVALLANVLARQQAADQNADDAILVRDGLLTEGSASNLFLVQDGVLLTPPKDQRILPGITRDLILELAAANSIRYEERDLPFAALAKADEIWLTSSTKEIMPVGRVDGKAVSDAKPGPLWRRMMAHYQDYKQQVCPAALGET